MHSPSQLISYLIPYSPIRHINNCMIQSATKLSMEHKMKSFSNFLTYEWNAASERDWYYIERNFIAAYFNAYKDSDLAQLSIPQSILHEAEEIWSSAYSQACLGNTKLLQHNIFNPLAPLLSHVNSTLIPEKAALSDQIEALNAHFPEKKTDITAIKQYLIKLTALRL